MKSKQLVFFFNFEDTSRPLIRCMKVQLIDQINVLANHVAGFFNDQYFWMESINVIDLLHRCSHQGRDVFNVMYLVRCSQVLPTIPKFT